MSRRKQRQRQQQPRQQYAGMPASVRDAMPPLVTPVADAAYDAAVWHGEPTRVTDAFSNPMARLGYGTPNLIEGTEYPLTRLTQNYQLLNSLYRGNWIVRKIVDTIPADMLKNWIKVVSQVPPEQIDQINKAMRQIQLRSQLALGLRWGRLYGGAGGLMLIKGHEEMLDQPLDLHLVMPDSFRGLQIIDRWSGIYPEGNLVTDISDPDYGLPEFYQVRDDSERTVARVHHSRIVRFTGARLPYWESISEMQWGASVIEAVYDDIRRRDNVVANIASLTFRANLTVMEVDGLAAMFTIANSQAQAAFWNMMQAQSILTSNLGVQLIDKGSKFETHQYNFAGLAEIYATLQMDVAGATGIPVTKLFGRSPAGMNATGDGDAENYAGTLEEGQETDLRPAFDRIMPVMAVSTWGELPDDMDYIFNTVRTPKVADMARIVRFKVAGIVDAFEKGLLDQGTAQKELRELAEDTGMFSNVTDAMIEAGLGKWVWQLGASADPFAGIRPDKPNPEDGEGLDV